LPLIAEFFVIFGMRLETVFEKAMASQCEGATSVPQGHQRGMLGS